MDDIKWGSGDIRYIGRALYSVRLDKRRPRGVPRSQTSAAIRILFLQTVAQHPRDLDGLRVRTDHSAGRRSSLAETKQKSVVDVRQTKPCPLPTPIVHKNLEARYAIIPHVTWHAGELGLRRNNEMIAEIDTGAGLRDRNDIAEDFLKRLRRHQIRNEAGDAAFCGGRGFTIRVHRYSRPRDIAAVAEMKMNVDDAGENQEAACGNFRLRHEPFTRRGNRRNASIADCDIAQRLATRREDGFAVAYHHIEIGHEAAPD